jgi:hypothetical protein
MKVLLLLSIMILAACGKYDIAVDSKLGTLNSLAPQEIKAGSSQHSKIKKICDGLTEKTTTFSSLVNTDYVFAGTSKACATTSSTFSPLPDSVVKLVNQSGSFKFTEGVNQFFFSDPETSDEGVLSLICDKIDTLVSPLLMDASGNSLLYFTTEGISSSDCSDHTDERCIKLEYATKVTIEKEGEKGRVHTREWLRMKLEPARVGFWIYRKKTSEAGCLEDQYFGRTATIK